MGKTMVWKKMTDAEKESVWARMNHREERVCPVCGNPLTGRSIQKYCSAHCRYIANRTEYWKQCEYMAASHKTDKKGQPKTYNFLTAAAILGRRLGKDYQQTMAAIRTKAAELDMTAAEAAEWMVQHD